MPRAKKEDRHMKFSTMITGAACIAVAVAAVATAQPTNITDTTAGTAVNNGTVGVGEYVGYSTGINSGFGDVLGATSQLHLDSSEAGQLNVGMVLGPAGFVDRGVIYLDTMPGGFTSTVPMTDDTDTLRKMISGLSSNQSADLVFAPGFEADFAIAFNEFFAGVWELRSGTLHGYTTNAYINSSDGKLSYEMNLPMWDIGMLPGHTLKYISTYGNPLAGDGGDFVRSDEFHGVAASTVTNGNPGTNTVTLASGDYNTFVSYGDSIERGPMIIQDDKVATATNDGTINEDEYIGYSLGINGSFADVMGNRSFLHLDSDPDGNIHIGLRRGPGSFSDHAVLYFDSVPGGPTDTTTLTDTGDALRAMISGTSTNGSSDLTFAPGFAPDYAIGFNGGFAAFWKIREGTSHQYLFTVDYNSVGSDYEMNMKMSDIGSKPGQSFKYILTYGNANAGEGVFRSDEFHGVKPSTVTGGNPGTNAVVLADGDYNVFQSVNPATLLVVR
jgi:hypothetical protein